MRAFLRRTAFCALAVLGLIVAVGIVQAVRGTMPELPHTVFDWVSTAAQTAIATVLMGTIVSLWLGFDDVKWPKPIKRIGIAYERFLGLFFVVGGAAQIGASLLLVGKQVLRWGQSGVWESIPLGRSFPTLPHLHWAPAQSILVWLMGTPAWIWAALLGVLIIRMGLPNLTAQHPETDSKENVALWRELAPYAGVPLARQSRPAAYSFGGAAVPRKISSRLAGASLAKKAGIVSFVLLGRLRNSTGHSVLRGSFTCTYTPGSGSLMCSSCLISARGGSAPTVFSENA